MKIVKFLGGLGNQMFQFAFYKALEKRNKIVRADTTGFNSYKLRNFELEEVFDINLNKASKLKIRLCNPEIRDWPTRKLRRIMGLKNAYSAENTPFCYDARLFLDQGTKLYWGYWQDQSYFIDIEDQIREDFKFIKPLNSKNSALLMEIQQSNSVSIHIRRGDYLQEELLGGLCSIDYYQRAIELISGKIEQPSFFIFSDDINWCKENLHIKHPKTFVTGNYGEKSYIDMQLMSNCNHNIIANSSFSWWAAWLNRHPQKIVIAPKKWINNDLPNLIVPLSWTKL